MEKNYIGISRDHSGSMRGLEKAAATDYNNTIRGIRTESIDAGQDTIMFVVKCGVGYGGAVVRESVNSSVAVLKEMNAANYIADGNSTPLYDSVGDLIEQFEAVATAAGDIDTASFLLLAITDGGENSSRKWSASKLSAKIKALQRTDRWTFVFRCPNGYARELMRDLGLHEGNIDEWSQTVKGMEESSAKTQAGFKDYFTGVKEGKKATQKFFTNLKDVSAAEVKAALTDISSQVKLWKVEAKIAIKPFVEGKLGGKPMAKGGAFYQLTKIEPEVQDYKQVIVRDKVSGSVYSGQAARDMIGLPRYGMSRVAPGDHGQYDIYLQSTSVNRALPAGTSLMYWPLAGVLK